MIKKNEHDKKNLTVIEQENNRSKTKEIATRSYTEVNLFYDIAKHGTFKLHYFVRVLYFFLKFTSHLQCMIFQMTRELLTSARVDQLLRSGGNKIIKNKK